MGLGRVDDVTLSQARKAATAARALKARGLDPIEARIEEKRTEVTSSHRSAAPSTLFEEFAEQYIAARESAWKNEIHRHQWRQSLKDYAYPVIGKVDVADVSTAHMLQILEPIWLTIPETASRVRGRVERILAAAAVKGLRTASNVAIWRGHLSEALPSRPASKHFGAMPYAEVPAFMAELRAIDTVSAAAFEFLILNASRTNEVRLARWPEISEAQRTWTIPAERMKSGREHIVPLSDPALAVLAEMKDLRGEATDLIFPGNSVSEPLSANTLLALLQNRLKRDCTTHGFRSAFRDWAGDETNFPRDIAEAALAHIVSDKTEAAYRRGTALAKRRELMAAWATFCAGADIIELKEIPAA
jgi:integrase